MWKHGFLPPMAFNNLVLLAQEDYFAKLEKKRWEKHEGEDWDNYRNCKKKCRKAKCLLASLDLKNG